ncbi:circadian phase modifier CpmA [Variovorax sp. WS11]|uniref:nickel pincer cofactor biosynthesis protein LarB n=1 Tax=Variovorax sp. WS11 TaxID=1105204 RepID=UPI000D0E1E39|nr:nickel pincer cofactor biosynthesis protein LarB [Variovorax sp. WS11]NDZ12748.1 nickel pincer cofactor biosynthesis protein LarB [Variovorax sp. WS11]PSL84686.1 circadian phase modifier CpmA [Variovorax sp. WS11]
MIEHGIQLDKDRRARLGFDEAIYAAGKSGEQLEALIGEAVESASSRLFTRLGPQQFEALPSLHQDALDYDVLSRTGIVNGSCIVVKDVPVAVLTAGSSDLPVAREVLRTLEYHGCRAMSVNDVGVAGLWRLLSRVDELRRMSVLVVAAGMEGALVSVVGGLLPGAVIALPTSVGYGVSAGGRTALHGALASCAPGVLVVNIDNGYGAACAALRILQAARPSADQVLRGTH